MSNCKCKDQRYVLVNVKKLDDGAIIPKYAHSTDACFDLHALTGGSINPGQRMLIKTGLAFELPCDYEIQVRPRSGNAYKYGITVLNTPGTIDQDYRGDLGVIIINHGDKVFEFEAGDKIAQAAIKPVTRAEFIEVKELGDTERGTGGFGSTGLKNREEILNVLYR